MQAENNFGVEFKPNRSKKNLFTLYLACGLFMVLGLVLLIAGILNSESWNDIDDKVASGSGLFGFALLLFLLGHFLTSPLNVHYFVGKNGLTLKAFRTTLSIPYNDIESLTHLKEKEGEAFILKLQNKTVDKQRENITEAMEAKEEGDFGNMWEQTKNAFKEQKKAYMKYKFLSVSITYSSSGRQRGPEKADNADLPCATIFMLLKNGEGYFISPLDIEGFMRETKKYMIT